MVPEMRQQLMKLGEYLRSLADRIQALCSVTGENKPEVKPDPEIPLEKVRGVLADKSRGGHTAEVRAIIQKFGADRLSDIDPKDYAAVLAEAEVLG